MHALLGLAFLGAALKLSRGRSESFGGLGTIPPPPPSHLDPDYEYWLSKTFSPGTPVRFVREQEVSLKSGLYTIPPGTVGVADGLVWMTDGWVMWVSGEVREDLFVSSVTHKFRVLVEVEDVEPLVDNWGPLTIPVSKSYKAGWTPKPTRYKGRP